MLSVAGCDSVLPQRELSAGNCFKAADCADSSQVCRQNQCTSCIANEECDSQICDTYGDLPGGGVGKCVPASSAIYVDGSEANAGCQGLLVPPSGAQDAPLCDIESALAKVKTNPNLLIRVVANPASYFLPPIDATSGTVRLVGPGFEPGKGATLSPDNPDNGSTFAFTGANVLIDGFLFSGSQIAGSGGQITIRRSRFDTQETGVRFDKSCTVTLDRLLITGGFLGFTFDSCTVNMTNSLMFQNNVDMINNFLNLNGGSGTFQFNTIAYNINMSTGPVAPIVNCMNAPDITVKNSIIVQNGVAQAIAQSCRTLADSNAVGQLDSSPGQLRQDPTFVDASSFDLRLNPADPTNQQFLIDRALDVAPSDKNIDHDYNGAPRPQGSGYDIGAFESAPNL